MTKRPSIEEKEMQKLENQFDKFEEDCKSLTMDRMNAEAKTVETEPQTKLSQREMDKTNDLYIKPERTLGSKEKFNERLRDKWNYDKQYVKFIAENKEIIGETIEMWTKPYPGVPAEFWKVPVNKPLYAPRYVAEQIKRKSYHRLKMDQSVISSADGMGKYYGSMVVDEKIPRLDAIPVTGRKSLFMGANEL